MKQKDCEFAFLPDMIKKLKKILIVKDFFISNNMKKKNYAINDSDKFFESSCENKKAVLNCNLDTA